MDDTFAFLAPGSDRRAEHQGVEALWEAVLERLPSQDRATLEPIRVGILDLSNDAVPFAYTNEGADCVNLTLEIKPDQLELNLVGWKEGQSDALKDWLQTVPGERAVNGLPGYEVIAFAREAYKKSPSSKPWWQSESVRQLGSCPAQDFNAGWVTRMMIGLPAKKTEVKPAFHVRRAWDRERAAAGAAAFVGEVAAEVERLLPILREIWG
jgi:hypothetical protein